MQHEVPLLSFHISVTITINELNRWDGIWAVGIGITVNFKIPTTIISATSDYHIPNHVTLGSDHICVLEDSLLSKT